MGRSRAELGRSVKSVARFFSNTVTRELRRSDGMQVPLSARVLDNGGRCRRTAMERAPMEQWRRHILGAGRLILALFATTASAQAQPGGSPLAAARDGEVRVFVSGALKASMEAVKAEAESAVDGPIAFRFGQSRILQQEIDSGQAFEVAILATPVIEEMVAKGKIRSGSESVLGHMPLAIGIRGASSMVDISKAESVRRALLGAKAVRRFFGVGASVPGVENLLKGLCVEEELKDRMIALGVNAPVRHVTLEPGEYELVVNLSSEILTMRGWTYLGVVPDPYQQSITFSAGAGARGDATRASALIRFLNGPGFDAALKKSGMTR
jgi:molybdate transport system substrate-binding protein